MVFARLTQAAGEGGAACLVFCSGAEEEWGTLTPQSLRALQHQETVRNHTKENTTFSNRQVLSPHRHTSHWLREVSN